MSNAPNLEPPQNFVDPRLNPEFDPGNWPLCDGEPAPPTETAVLHEMRCIEFLAAYYRLNVLNGQLLSARTSGANEAVIRELLQAIGEATASLERLEDRYAAIGFYGEPVMDGIRYRSIVFSHPARARGAPMSVPVSFHAAIPGLEEIPESELQGQAKVYRWGHGKMDL